VLEIDYSSRYPKVRDYAKTTGDVIYFSPKILKATKERMDGLMRHEFAHVILMKQGDFDHSEREADIVAESVFGGNIYYDEDDVQTTLRGKRPRPLHLPQ
jgi:predicted SprT family Zn-dependent metalloprotease